MAKSRKESKDGFIRRVFRRYFIDAMSAMALGLFASLIIATILNQLGRIPGLSVLSDLAATVTGAGSVVTGAAIGVAVAWGLGHKPLVVFSSVAVGAIAYAAGGGPIGAYAAAVVGAEIGGLIAGALVTLTDYKTMFILMTAVYPVYVLTYLFWGRRHASAFRNWKKAEKNGGNARHIC